MSDKCIKIKSFYIGSETGSGAVYEDEENFISALRDLIHEAAENGHEHFDITIEPSE